MLTFITTYLLLIIIGSLFCCGWYIITRSAESILPDGRKVNEGMIFGFWERFFEGIVGYKRIDYSGTQLEEKVEQLFKYIPSFKLRLQINPERLSLTVTGNDLSRDEKKQIEDLLNVNILNNGYIFFYDRYAVYQFPSWVRKPFSSCTVCMASVFGSAVYFVFSDRLNMFDSLSDQLILWLPYCVSVALVNKVITDKFNL